MYGIWGRIDQLHNRLAGSELVDSDAAGNVGQTQTDGIATICADWKSMYRGGFRAGVPYRNTLVNGRCLHLAAVPEKGSTANKGLEKLQKNAGVRASRWRKPTGVVVRGHRTGARWSQEDR